MQGEVNPVEIYYYPMAYEHLCSWNFFKFYVALFESGNEIISEFNQIKADFQTCFGEGKIVSKQRK